MSDKLPTPLRPLPRSLRITLLTLGWVCVALGIVGLAVPLMPGTVFLIVAAACFARSSPRFEQWLMTHPRLGPPVVAWRLHGAIPPKIKLIAVTSMLLSGGLLWMSGAPRMVAAGVTLALVAVAIFIVTRPAGPKDDLLTPP